MMMICPPTIIDQWYDGRWFVIFWSLYICVLVVVAVYITVWPTLNLALELPPPSTELIVIIKSHRGGGLIINARRRIVIRRRRGSGVAIVVVQVLVALATESVDIRALLIAKARVAISVVIVPSVPVIRGQATIT